MEEIERSQGVTIVDMQSEDETEDETDSDTEPGEDVDTAERPSIGEEVEATPEPLPDTEEAQVQRGLADVASVLDGNLPSSDLAEEADRDDGDEEDAYESESHGFVPVPTGETAPPHDDGCVEAVFEGHEDEDEDAYEEEEEDEEDVREGEYLEADEDEEDDEDEAEDEAEDEDGEYLEADEDEYEDEGEEEPADDEEVDELDEGEYLEADEETEEEPEEEEDEEEDEEEEEEFGFAVVEDEVEVEDEEEDEEEDDVEEDEAEEELEAVGGDPYAQGGLIRQTRELHGAPKEDEERPYTAFDWRGRPLE
jgi:hypothetical protein